MGCSQCVDSGKSKGTGGQIYWKTRLLKTTFCFKILKLYNETCSCGSSSKHVLVIGRDNRKKKGVI